VTIVPLVAGEGSSTTQWQLPSWELDGLELLPVPLDPQCSGGGLMMRNIFLALMPSHKVLSSAALCFFPSLPSCPMTYVSSTRDSPVPSLSVSGPVVYPLLAVLFLTLPAPPSWSAANGFQTIPVLVSFADLGTAVPHLSCMLGFLHPGPWPAGRISLLHPLSAHPSSPPSKSHSCLVPVIVTL
jgi:hypothetical protein